MEKKNIRLGIVGTGRIANRFIPEVSLIKQFTVEAVYNPTKRSAENFAKKHMIAEYMDDYDSFLSKIDAVYIASPHGTHYLYAKKAIMEKKHVLCEKPMVLERSQAQELFDLADEYGCVLMEGIKTLYAPGFEKLCDLISEGTIGIVRDVEASFTKLVSGGRELEANGESGSLTELGSYVLCGIFCSLGYHYKTLHFESIRNEDKVDIYTKAYFIYDSAYATAKVGLGVKSEGEMVISGTEGCILVKAPWWKTSRIEIHREDVRENITLEIPFEGDGLRYELKEFYRQIEQLAEEKGNKNKELSIAIADVMEQFLSHTIIPLKVYPGRTIYSSTGRIGFDQADRMSSMHFYKASVGSRLHLLDNRYYYNVATYAMRYDDKYIYTYDYEPEESWTTYRHDLYGDTYIQNDYVFHDECYFRICLKKVSGEAFTQEDADRINQILEYQTKIRKTVLKPWFRDEIVKVSDEVNQERTDKHLAFALMTDTHYTINGTWEDTVLNIQRVNERVSLDGIIHLGDWTDGMLSSDLIKDYVHKMQKDLSECGCPIYAALGNHDSNYFSSTPELLDWTEQVKLYLPADVEKPYYYKDFPQNKLRCIFLASFDVHEKVRYGFWIEEIEWLEKTLAETDTEWSVIVFSHDAPMEELDYWTDEIRNGEKLMEVLEQYQDRTNGNLMAYIHGHTHADFIYDKKSFPIISIGCTKCEFFLEKKPEGAVCYPRKPQTISQDLWDVLLIDTEKKQLQFIRFGAGENRTILCSRKVKEGG